MLARLKHQAGNLSGSGSCKVRGHPQIRQMTQMQIVGCYTSDERGPSGVGGWPALRTTWSYSMKHYGRNDWYNTGSASRRARSFA